MNYRKQLFAAALLTALNAHVLAQEGVQTFRDEVLSTRSRAEVAQELTLARIEGRLENRGETYGSFGPELRSNRSMLTRAEVLADLQLWREAGMTDLTSGEGGYNVFSSRYREARARYQTLRASPRYAELVLHIARQRGETVATAQSASPVHN